MTIRCRYCGRFFVPDKRVGARQKACSRTECKKARKKEAQDGWCKENPGYFKGRSWYTKELRIKRKALGFDGKVLQDKIPLVKPLRKLVLLIPDNIQEMLQDEITLKRLNRSTFEACGGG